MGTGSHETHGAHPHSFCKDTTLNVIEQLNQAAKRNDHENFVLSMILGASTTNYHSDKLWCM
jgi:hypothetical protein